MNIFTTSNPFVFYSMFIIHAIIQYNCPKQNMPSAMFEPLLQLKAREDKKSQLQLRQVFVVLNL
jgi:hypothetical protein